MALNARKQELLRELETLTDILVADHREMAQFLIAERNQKITGFAEAEGDTIAARNHNADLHSFDTTTDVFKLKAKIAGHEARIAYITTALKYQE